MKTITRDIKIHRYTFGKYDAATNQVQDVFRRESATPLTRAEINAICKERDGACRISYEVVSERYSCPVDYFIKACNQYAIDSDTAFE